MDIEKPPVKLDGIEIPSIFKLSNSFIITLSRPNRSFNAVPALPMSLGAASKSLNPFSNWPQSLRRARYGVKREESILPR